MQTLCFLLPVALMVQTVLSWESSGTYPFDPDHPNQCYDPDTKEFHDLNSKWQDPTFCATVGCYADQNETEFEILETGCGISEIHEARNGEEEECTVIEDRDANYPDCCPTTHCKLKKV